MAPTITPVETAQDFPPRTSVVIIGGGIVGLTAALTLAEKNIPVVVLEKGRLAGEQSSRNLGWVRKTIRAAPDVPLAMAADRLWAAMAMRVGANVGYERTGIMYLDRTEADVAGHEDWLKSVSHLGLDSRLVTPSEIDELVPGGEGKWAGGLYTPSDGHADPTLAASAIAKAAISKGAIVVENCAVRTLSLEAGRVAGVVTERGEIRCDHVLLAGGLWSRRFLGNLGISLPTLPLVCSAFRSPPMQGPCKIGVAGPDFSFCQHHDGSFIMTQRAALMAPLTLDHVLIGMRYLSQLRGNRGIVRMKVGRETIDDLKLPRRWGPADESPFEKLRVMDPPTVSNFNREAVANLSAAWPSLKGVEIESAWAGTMDITPDTHPVIGPVASIPGLTLATGFSGHGFGTSPAAGQLAAELVTGETPIVDPAPYRFERF
ncbi:FAD-binding oxidoreductase [Afifella sp. JA880]|uniref:NAD(P)/FAD-dependent oxidoreductase n=1 Tax=Afifella sp. JA880 TaxID=2975280 RepID=UPI0021BA4D63|nr:FAD-binding oxidoreductase [Afifella sp. JA880]MCT8266302.1 FAD-binding oxidoreductase [Afifella sp. JA880]